MYRCQVCGDVVPANTPALRKVVETRRREYSRRTKANQFRKDGRKEHTADPGGVGTEIVREILVCPSCSRQPADNQCDRRGPPALALAA